MEDGKKEPISHDTPHRRGVLRGVAADAPSDWGCAGARRGQGSRGARLSRLWNSR